MSLLLAHRAIEKVDIGGGIPVPELNYWPFLGNTDDIVGGNDGINNGAVLTTDKGGNANSAYLFAAGENDWVDLTSSNNIGKVHTITFRIKASKYGTIIMNNALVNYMFFNSNVAFRYQGTGGVANFTISPALSINVYYDFAIIRDGTSVSLYVDAVKQGSTLMLAADNDYIFNNLTYQGSFDYEGVIDNFRIYNRVITQDEIDLIHTEV